MGHTTHKMFARTKKKVVYIKEKNIIGIISTLDGKKRGGIGIGDVGSIQFELLKIIFGKNV